MDIKEIKNISKKELQELLAEKREKYRGLRFGVSEAQQKNVRGIRKLRKDIAQILTLLNKQA